MRRRLQRLWGHSPIFVWWFDHGRFLAHPVKTRKAVLVGRVEIASSWGWHQRCANNSYHAKVQSGMIGANSRDIRKMPKRYKPRSVEDLISGIPSQS